MKNSAKTHRLQINNGNVELHTTVYSADKLDSIILLHGGPGVPDEMTEVVNFLKNNFRVITFEQRGIGLSECTGCSFTMNDYISDLDAICNHFNIDTYHLFGHSWGGLYAQIYALENPYKIKSLFLCSPSSGTNTTWKETEKEVLKFNKEMSSNTVWLQMGWHSLLGMLGSDKAYRKMFKLVLKNYHSKYKNVNIEDGLLEKIHSKPINFTRKEIIKYKPLATLNDPKFPIMITYGTNDIYGESKNKLIERLPTAKINYIKNCGHIPWKHNLEAFENILNDFYRDK